MLVTAKGEIYPVEMICVEVVDIPEKVYNFQVEDFHTYYVGENGIWVHNECGGEVVKVTSNLGKEIDISPSDNHSTVSKNPGPTGLPNTSVDILDETGNVATRRWYDSKGNAYRDVDMTNHRNSKTHPEYPHEHTWDWIDGVPKRK